MRMASDAEQRISRVKGGVRAGRVKGHVGNNNCTPPKRRFWNAEQKMRCGFSIDFSMARCPKLRTHAVEKCFERPHFIFCSSFQNLRLGSINCATYPGRIGWVLNDVQGMLTSKFSSLMGLPNPAWVSRAIVVSHMGGLKGRACRSC
jgi:hypothetical protein